VNLVFFSPPLAAGVTHLAGVSEHDGVFFLLLCGVIFFVFFAVWVSHIVLYRGSGQRSLSLDFDFPRPLASLHHRPFPCLSPTIPGSVLGRSELENLPPFPFLRQLISSCLRLLCSFVRFFYGYFPFFSCSDARY